ncbi:LAMI_0H00694g1_1 [Lachancea mirantina]|uniref:LAMI_0H00694g1_1 n=1 Tax=Lachancea mirantina TaxID=1230905 RepID=A0A1G4KDI4_9SACH|nr:LAMI_0H00694g1_1 [Lachancea mirantina]
MEYEPKRSILLPSKAEQGNNDNVQIVESEFPSRGERGRTREKRSTAGGVYSRSGSGNTSRGSSRASSRIKVESDAHLKWTLLRRDPSERLQGDDDDKSQEEGEEASDEELVSDVENDADIDETLDYDLGSRVLPNYTVNLFSLVSSRPAWLAAYNKEQAPDKHEVRVDDMGSGYLRAADIFHSQKSDDTEDSSKRDSGSRYIAFVDLTTESMYSVGYVVGSVLSSNDTLYVLHHSGTGTADQLRANVGQLRANVAFALDAAAASLENIKVVILSVTHPYSKHLLNELILAIEPISLCVPLSLVLSKLQSYVCPVPTLVIRRKLRRSKRRGITD